MKNYLIVSNDGQARGLMTFAYFKKRLNELKLAGRVNVQLAGLMVTKGINQDSGALNVLKKRNIPVADFRAQAVSDDLLGQADTLVAVSEVNHHYLRNTYAAVPSEVRVLKVPSVIDGKEESYEKAFDKITEGLERELQSLIAKN